MNPDTYYRKRYMEELLAAEQALSPVAKDRHSELASLYLRKADSAEPKTKARKAA